MCILNFEKMVKDFFRAPTIKRSYGQVVTDDCPLDDSFEMTTYINVFGDGAALYSDKAGSVNIMASFRNKVSSL